MDKVEKIKLRNEKENKGFEIISLQEFFKSVDETFIKKYFRTEFYSLIFVTKGECTHEIDFLKYKIKVGETLVISSNRIHSYNEFENVEGYLVMFTEGFLCEFLSSNNSDAKELFKESYLNPHIKYKDLDKYNSTLKKLFDVVNDMYKSIDEIIGYETIVATLKSLIMIVFRCMMGTNSSNKKMNEIFIEFTELIDTYIDTEKTLDGYAKMLHVSKKTVNAMTRKAVDMSAKEYIIQQLLLKMKLKLCFEQKSINEIANELGFKEGSKRKIKN